MPRHPHQPIVWDKKVLRFKENKIVSYLLECCQTGKSTNLNEIATLPFSTEDRVQFAQLIGYSVGGFGDLSYVPRKTVKEVDAIAQKMIEKRKK